MPGLAWHYRVLMRCHGDTRPPPEGASSLPGLAGGIAGDLDRLTIEKAQLMGASAGASSARATPTTLLNTRCFSFEFGLSINTAR